MAKLSVSTSGTATYKALLSRLRMLARGYRSHQEIPLGLPFTIDAIDPERGAVTVNLSATSLVFFTKSDQPDADYHHLTNCIYVDGDKTTPPLKVRADGLIIVSRGKTKRKRHAPVALGVTGMRM